MTNNLGRHCPQMDKHKYTYTNTHSGESFKVIYMWFWYKHTSRTYCYFLWDEIGLTKYQNIATFLFDFYFPFPYIKLIRIKFRNSLHQSFDFKILFLWVLYFGRLCFGWSVWLWVNWGGLVGLISFNHNHISIKVIQSVKSFLVCFLFRLFI